MTVVGTVSTRAAHSPRHRRDTRLVANDGGRVRARRTDELAHWSAGRALPSAGLIRAGAGSEVEFGSSGLPLPHLSKDRRAEKVTPIASRRKATRGKRGIRWQTRASRSV